MRTERGLSAAPTRWSGAQRAWLVLGLLLLVLRLGHVVWHQPLAGFANQFDMLRTTGCLGLVPDIELPPGTATPQAPQPMYKTEAGASSSCLRSTEVAIVAIVLALDSVADQIGVGDASRLSLRMVAMVKALLLLLMVICIQHALRWHPRAALAHAWLAALVLADPFNTLYLASFYTEFAALLSAWAALALLLIWRRRASAPGALALLGWGLLLALLLGSRFAHVALPFVLLFALVWCGHRRGWSAKRLAIWPLLLLLPALAMQVHEQSRQPGVRAANTLNSYFGAAVPAASDAEDFVVRSGLPAECASLVHTTWYLQRGRDVVTACPQAMSLSRLRWLSALAVDPAALVRWIGRGVLLSGQWRPSYLGELAGEQFQRLPAGPLGLGLSVADAIARLPYLALLAFWGAPVLAALSLSLRRQRPAAQACVPTSGWAAGLFPLLAVTIVLGWFVSLAGDGYSELARHLHLAANAALASWLLLMAKLVGLLGAGAPPVGVRQRWMIAASAGAVLALVALSYRQGLAYGVLDIPADERWQGQPVAISGWALDPRGISRVECRAPGRAPVSLSLQSYPVLAGIFGSGVGQHGRQFAATVELPESGEFSIVVVPQSGAETVIDRRWMQRSD